MLFPQCIYRIIPVCRLGLIETPDRITVLLFFDLTVLGFFRFDTTAAPGILFIPVDVQDRWQFRLFRTRGSICGSPFLSLPAFLIAQIFISKLDEYWGLLTCAAGRC